MLKKTVLITLWNTVINIVLSVLPVLLQSLLIFYPLVLFNMETKDDSHLIFMKTYITFYYVGMLQLDKLMELPVNSLLSKSGASTSISSHDNAFPPLGTGSRRLVLPALARNVPPGHPARQRSSYHAPPL